MLPNHCQPALDRDADMSHADRDDGFFFSYKMGSYISHLAIRDNTCDEVIDAFARFLLGCGFAPQNVIDNMTSVSERLEEAWFPGRPVEIWKELEEELRPSTLA